MTEIGGGRVYGGGYGADPGHHTSPGHDVPSYGQDVLSSGHDVLFSGEDVLSPARPDPAVRRQAAEANARAAEARAAVEAGAAARAAVQADAELGVTGRPDLGDPLAVGVGTHPAPPWAAGPRHGAPEDPFHPGPPLADPAADTDVLHHVVPAPRPEPARHAAPADAAYPDAAHPDDAPVAPGGRAERRRSASWMTW